MELKELKEKIVKAVPEIETGYRITEFHEKDWAKVKKGRPIMPSDIIKALLKNQVQNKYPDMFYELIYGYTHSLDWGKPLDDQSPETILFLNKLI